jgi:RNA polymerase sigma factor (sigma-70 family)
MRQAIERRSPASEGELLDRFVRDGDETAFAALVDRHGPRVFGLCRWLLGHEQDAEDVFQATFLLLARRASTVSKRASVGSWLYGVAYRLALKQRAITARRRERERSATPVPVPDPVAAVTWRELRAVLDEELGRLPDRYRAPLLLCYFEGLTQDEAARRLGWKPRTVKARLARGRDLLRRRLPRRGLTLSAALTGSLVAPAEGAVAVPVALAEATARAAKLFAVGSSAGGAASAQAATLAAGGLRMMFLHRLSITVAIILAAALVAGGAGLLVGRVGPEAPAEAKPQAPAANASAPAARPPAGTDRWGDPLPAGAVARLGTVRFRVNEFVQGLAFLPGGKTLVTAEDQFHRIQFWNAGTGRLQREFSTAPLTLQSGGFAMSPEGKRIAVSGLLHHPDNPDQPGAVRVLDAASGKIVRNFARSVDDIQYCPLAFSPNGKALASLGYPSGVLRIEDIASGAELVRHTFPRRVLGGLAMSGDGKTLAVATLKLYAWRWQDGLVPRELKAPNFVARWPALSPDGKLLACTGDRGEPVHVWDVATGRLRFLPNGPGKEHVYYSIPIFSPDGKTLAVSGHRSHSVVDVWDVATGGHRRRLDTEGGRLAFSPDSRRLASAAATVRVWDVESGKEVAANDEGHRSDIAHVAAAGGLIATSAVDHTARLWDRASARQCLKLAHHDSYVSVALTPDGQTVATGSLDDSVRLWDTHTGRQLHRLRGHGRVGREPVLALTPDGRRLLSWGMADFHLRVWDVRSGKALLQHALRPAGVRLPDARTELLESDWLNLAIGGATFSPDGKLFVLPVGRAAHVFDVQTGREVRTIDIDIRSPNVVAVSADGKRLLASGWGDDIKTKLPNGQKKSTPAVTFPLGLWDLTTGTRLRQVFLPGGTNGPIAFSTDGRTYAAATEMPAGIRLWDTASGRELAAITGFRGRVRALAFAPAGRFLISGMSDTTALVWQVPGGKQRGPGAQAQPP